MQDLRATARRRMYRQDGLRHVTSVLNRATAALASAGIGPQRLVTLEVAGRRRVSGLPDRLGAEHERRMSGR